MEIKYPARFREKRGCVTVLFVDFECATQGETFDEAMEMAKEAAEGWVLGEIARGEPLPVPSDLGRIKTRGGGEFTAEVPIMIFADAIKGETSII